MATKRNNSEPAGGYDLSKGERGKFFRKLARDVVVVELDPDVAEHFRDAESVNRTLRAIVKSIRTPQARKTA